MNKLLGPKGEGYVIIQFILFALIWFAPGKFVAGSAWPTPLGFGARLLGTLFLLYGVVMVGLGVLNLGTNLTAVPHPKKNAQFVEAGAYKLVRHPIYSGIIFGGIGWGFFNQAEITVLLALLLLPFFDIKVRREEHMLAAKFPAYTNYQQRVKKFIPFLY